MESFENGVIYSRFQNDSKQKNIKTNKMEWREHLHFSCQTPSMKTEQAGVLGTVQEERLKKVRKRNNLKMETYENGSYWKRVFIWTIPSC